MLLDEDVKEGWGILVGIDGGYLYEGYFKDNHFHEKGRIIFSDGFVYEGQWNDDSLNGKCI